MHIKWNLIFYIMYSTLSFSFNEYLNINFILIYVYVSAEVIIRLLSARLI